MPGIMFTIFPTLLYYVGMPLQHWLISTKHTANVAKTQVAICAISFTTESYHVCEFFLTHANQTQLWLFDATTSCSKTEQRV